MSETKPRPGTQTIYSESGEVILLGQWEPKKLLEAISGPDGPWYWPGKKVLDIGANTFGLSLEITRAGAKVVAIEPDPFDWYFKLVKDDVDRVIADEGLRLEIHRDGLFEAHKYGPFDVVLLLGIIYHFRDIQYILDFLSTLETKEIIISTQTHPGEDLAIYNRMDPSIMPATFWENYKEPMSGWHPTRPMFERMLAFSGFDNITPLTDPSVNFPSKPMPGLTNSAYYRATKVRSTDIISSRTIYFPR